MAELRRASAPAKSTQPAAIPVPEPDAASAHESTSTEATSASDTPAGPTVEGAAALAEGEAAFEVLPGDAIPDDALVGAVSPETISAIAGSGAELDGADAELESGGEAEAREAGSSVDGLAGLLSGVWDQLIAGAQGIGRSAADALLRFLQLSDYEIGNKLGYVAGMVLLEVLLTVLSGGAWLEASAAAKFLRPLVRILDLGGEIMGAIARGFRAVRGPLMRGLGAARGFLGRFRVVGRILDKLESAAHFLFRFGDEAAGAASHGGGRAAGHADDVARHADDVARHGDDAARHADDAGRHADDAARHGDDAGRQADDVAREAAEKPAAVAMARAIMTVADRVDAPLPLLLAELNGLRTRYPWIDAFRHFGRGMGRYEIHMIASDTNLGTVDLGDETRLDTGEGTTNIEAKDRASWKRDREAGRPVDLTEEMRVDIDEPLAVGERGISRAEAMRRATDPMNREFLDEITNRITKNARTPFSSAAPRPPGRSVSLADNPSALITHRFAEVREMNTLFTEAMSGLPPGLSPGATKAEINRRLWALIRGERAAPPHVADAARAVREAFEKNGLDPMTRGFRPPPVARRAHGLAPTRVPRIVNDVLTQPGQPLDPDTCARMERSIGGRFDAVRIHAGGTAAVSACALHADAYTVGRHLVFGPNRYAPSTPAGDRLLAHELTHAKQQSFAEPPAALKIGSTQDPAEAEAAAAEHRTGLLPTPAHPTHASRVMRSPDDTSEDEASPEESTVPALRPTRLYGFSSAELSRGQPFTDEQIYGDLNAANERIARENPPARPPFAKRYARAQWEIPTTGYSASELFDFGKSRGYFYEYEHDAVYEKHYGRIAKHSKTRDQFEAERYNQQINRFRAFRNQMNLAPIQATLLGPARAFGATASGLYFSYQTADTIVQTHRAVTQGDTATAVVISAPALLGLAIPRLLKANPKLPITRSGNSVEVQVITKPVVTPKAIAQGYKVGDRPVLYIAEVDPQVVPGNQLPNTMAGTAPSGFFVKIKARVVDAQSGEVLASREAWAQVPAPSGPPASTASATSPPTTTTAPSNPRLPPAPT
ncbi:MAG TPA: DUF4157 domain-containing protein, partial [Opitutaceae bacterium]